MSFGNSWGAFFFNKLKQSPYIVPRLGEISHEAKLIEATKPWLRLKIFDVPTCESRLPEHYKRFYWLWKHGEKTSIHHIEDKSSFKLDKDKERVVPVTKFVPQIVYPDNCDDQLWGGVGIVKGYLWRGRYKGEQPKYWWPNLEQSVLYSEILDKYFDIVVTSRALELIDDHYGFDNYLLKSSYADINSLLGFKIKREMLLALANQTLYPDDPQKRKDITEKYKEYIIPVDEADWIGLSLEEATKKQEQLEMQVQPIALKHEFRAQLLQYLKDNPPVDGQGEDISVPVLQATQESSSWLQKLNPFTRST